MGYNSVTVDMIKNPALKFNLEDFRSMVEPGNPNAKGKVRFTVTTDKNGNTKVGIGMFGNKFWWPEFLRENVGEKKNQLMRQKFVEAVHEATKLLAKVPQYEKTVQKMIEIASGKEKFDYETNHENEASYSSETLSRKEIAEVFATYDNLVNSEESRKDMATNVMVQYLKEHHGKSIGAERLKTIVAYLGKDCVEDLVVFNEKYQQDTEKIKGKNNEEYEWTTLVHKDDASSNEGGNVIEVPKSREKFFGEIERAADTIIKADEEVELAADLYKEIKNYNAQSKDSGDFTSVQNKLSGKLWGLVKLRTGIEKFALETTVKKLSANNKWEDKVVTGGTDPMNILIERLLPKILEKYIPELSKSSGIKQENALNKVGEAKQMRTLMDKVAEAICKFIKSVQTIKEEDAEHRKKVTNRILEGAQKNGNEVYTHDITDHMVTDDVMEKLYPIDQKEDSVQGNEEPVQDNKAPVKDKVSRREGEPIIIDIDMDKLDRLPLKEVDPYYGFKKQGRQLMEDRGKLPRLHLRSEVISTMKEFHNKYTKGDSDMVLRSVDSALGNLYLDAKVDTLSEVFEKSLETGDIPSNPERKLDMGRVLQNYRARCKKEAKDVEVAIKMNTNAQESLKDYGKMTEMLKERLVRAKVPQPIIVAVLNSIDQDLGQRLYTDKSSKFTLGDLYVIKNIAIDICKNKDYIKIVGEMEKSREAVCGKMKEIATAFGLKDDDKTLKKQLDAVDKAFKDSLNTALSKVFNNLKPWEKDSELKPLEVVDKLRNFLGLGYEPFAADKSAAEKFETDAIKKISSATIDSQTQSDKLVANFLKEMLNDSLKEKAINKSVAFGDFKKNLGEYKGKFKLDYWDGGAQALVLDAWNFGSPEPSKNETNILNRQFEESFAQMYETLFNRAINDLITPEMLQEIAKKGITAVNLTARANAAVGKKSKEYFSAVEASYKKYLDALYAECKKEADAIVEKRKSDFGLDKGENVDKEKKELAQALVLSFLQKKENIKKIDADLKTIRENALDQILSSSSSDKSKKSDNSKKSTVEVVSQITKTDVKSGIGEELETKLKFATEALGLTEKLESTSIQKREFAEDKVKTFTGYTTIKAEIDKHNKNVDQGDKYKDDLKITEKELKALTKNRLDLFVVGRPADRHRVFSILKKGRDKYVGDIKKNFNDVASLIFSDHKEELRDPLINYVRGLEGQCYGFQRDVIDPLMQDILYYAAIKPEQKVDGKYVKDRFDTRLKLMANARMYAFERETVALLEVNDAFVDNVYKYMNEEWFWRSKSHKNITADRMELAKQSVNLTKDSTKVTKDKETLEKHLVDSNNYRRDWAMGFGLEGLSSKITQAIINKIKDDITEDERVKISKKGADEDSQKARANLVDRMCKQIREMYDNYGSAFENCLQEKIVKYMDVKSLVAMVDPNVDLTNLTTEKLTQLSAVNQKLLETDGSQILQKAAKAIANVVWDNNKDILQAGKKPEEGKTGLVPGEDLDKAIMEHEDVKKLLDLVRTSYEGAKKADVVNNVALEKVRKDITELIKDRESMVNFLKMVLGADASTQKFLEQFIKVSTTETIEKLQKSVKELYDKGNDKLINALNIQDDDIRNYVWQAVLNVGYDEIDHAAQNTFFPWVKNTYLPADFLKQIQDAEMRQKAGKSSPADKRLLDMKEAIDIDIGQLWTELNPISKALSSNSPDKLKGELKMYAGDPKGYVDGKVGNALIQARVFIENGVPGKDNTTVARRAKQVANRCNEIKRDFEIRNDIEKAVDDNVDTNIFPELFGVLWGEEKVPNWAKTKQTFQDRYRKLLTRADTVLRQNTGVRKGDDDKVVTYTDPNTRQPLQARLKNVRLFMDDEYAPDVHQGFNSKVREFRSNVTEFANGNFKPMDEVTKHLKKLMNLILKAYSDDASVDVVTDRDIDELRKLILLSLKSGKITVKSGLANAMSKVIDGTEGKAALTALKESWKRLESEERFGTDFIRYSNNTVYRVMNSAD